MKVTLERIKAVVGDLSVNSLAKTLGMAQTTLNAYLNGKHKITIELVKQISATFGVSADWLLGLTDERGGSETAAEGADDGARIKAVEAENAALKGEIRGLRFALEASVRKPAPPSLYDSASGRRAGGLCS